MGLSRSEKQKRERTVIKLLARGYKTAEIAEILGFGKKTLRRVVKGIEKSEDEELMRYTLLACQREMTRRERELRLCAWEIFQDRETSTPQKIAVLRFLAQLDSRAMGLFERLGLMERISRSEELGFEGLGPEELKRIGREILEELRTKGGSLMPGGVHEEPAGD